MQWTSAVLLTFAMLTAAGCGGTVGDFRRIQDTGPSIYMNGPLEAIQRAALDALAEARLGAPQMEATADGVLIFAEQTTLGGAVFNSYGGFGKVTIKRTASPDTFSVSVITRSRLAHEPAGPQDVLKGYNYNDPRVATAILQRVNELSKQTSR